MADYEVVPDNPERDVPNPKRAELAVKLQQAKAEFERLTAEYGAEAFMEAEQNETTLRHPKAAVEKQLAKRMREAFDRITELEQKRRNVPARIPVAVATGKEIVKLNPERKLLTNLIKMVAYQAESDLVHLVSPYYKRAMHEGRTLIQSALALSTDIDVVGDKLRVLLGPLSSPHRTLAIAGLCEDLNCRSTVFPGSRLQLEFAVASSKPKAKRTIS